MERGEKFLRKTFFLYPPVFGECKFFLLHSSVLKMHTKKCSLKFFLNFLFKVWNFDKNYFSPSYRGKFYNKTLSFFFSSKKSAIIEITGRAIKTHQHALRYRSQNILKRTQRNIFYESCRFSLSIFSSSVWVALKHVRTHSASSRWREGERERDSGAIGERWWWWRFTVDIHWCCFNDSTSKKTCWGLVHQQVSSARRKKFIFQFPFFFSCVCCVQKHRAERSNRREEQ